jgi:hypothetical protein
MAGSPVDLDHHPLLAPEGIDQEALDPHVELGDRQVLALAEDEEGTLELRASAGELRLVALQRFAQHGRARAALADQRLQRVELEIAVVLGLGQRAPQPLWLGAGEVEEYMRHWGDREVSVPDAPEIAPVVDLDLGKRFAPSRRADVGHGRLVLEQSEPPSGRGVREHRVRTCVQGGLGENGLD